jgi:hypothetical protein
LADQGEAASSPAECAAVCPFGIDCSYLFNNNTCAADPACASAPSPAPSLDTTGLAAAVVLLSGLAAVAFHLSIRFVEQRLVNPATGAAIKIPAKKVVKFRVAKAVKDAIVPPKKK